MRRTVKKKTRKTKYVSVTLLSILFSLLIGSLCCSGHPLHSKTSTCSLCYTRHHPQKKEADWCCERYRLCLDSRYTLNATRSKPTLPLNGMFPLHCAPFTNIQNPPNPQPEIYRYLSYRKRSCLHPPLQILASNDPLGHAR
jgi:hypothetical protein